LRAKSTLQKALLLQNDGQSAQLRFAYSPEHEMQFAGHPIIELHGFDE
jgi:predicted PhzF superfamily epimerase YddE/YHI9